MKHFNTVFSKLFISYITITIVITVLLGSTSYFYFSANYKKQLININNKMLEYDKKTLELSIFKKIESLYVSLSTQQLNPYYNDMIYLFDRPYYGNQSKIYNISEYLKSNLSNNFGLVNGIHLYIPYNNLIISSTWGVKYMDSTSNEIANSIDWFNESDNPPLLGKWMDTRVIANAFSTGYSFNNFTYLRIYPMFSSNINKPGIIAIDLNEAAVSSILKDLNPSPKNNTIIINKSGKIIFDPDSSKLYNDLHSTSYISKIMNSNGNGNFISNVNGISSMVSYAVIDNTSWKIITYTPVNEFYKQSAVIQQEMMILCILAIIIGFVLTNIFSIKMYNPVKSLIHLTKTLFIGDKALPEQYHEYKENEYTLIKNVINELSFKVVALEKNISEYQPLVKHNLVISLFNNSILSIDELIERAKLANIVMNKPCYSCMIVKFRQDIIKSIGMQNSHYARYNIIKFIENMSNETLEFWAVELSCNSLGVIINSMEDIKTQLSEVINHIITFSQINFNLAVTLSISNMSSDPLTLSVLYEESLVSSKYNFFFPESNIILYEDISNRELSGEKSINLPIEDFAKAINLQDINGVCTYLEKLSNILLTGSYSADYCQKKLLDLVDILCNDINNLNLNCVFNTTKFYSDFNILKNINEYQDWMVSNAKEFFKFAKEKKGKKNIELIETAKEYILENLDSQLSLESTASAVDLNPKYLSKLFKEITGINFLDYITKLRLEKSKLLLVDTTLNIEKISYEIGYNTPAYFIRQFKKSYGLTPAEYRKMSAFQRV